MHDGRATSRDSAFVVGAQREKLHAADGLMCTRYTTSDDVPLQQTVTPPVGCEDWEVWGDLRLKTVFGASGQIVREHLGDGRTIYYDGPKGAERRYRATRANGDVQIFVGERGAERMVSAVRIDGTREFYAGPPGDAYLTRTIYPDGRIVFRRGRTPQRVPVAGVWHADGPRGPRVR